MARFAHAFLAVSLLFAAPSFAAVITTYSSQASFDAALTSFATIDFNQTPQDFSTPAGYTSSGVQFVGNNPAGNYLAIENWGAYTLNGGPVLRLAYYFPTSATSVTLPRPVTAIGFDAFTVSPAGGTFIITFPAELNVAPMSFHVTAVAGASSWIGMVSDTPFSSLVLQTFNTTNGGAQGIIDNFQFGDAQASGGVSDTPEIATMLMIGFGLFALKSSSRFLQRLA